MTNVTFRVADAMALPFDDGTFDVVHAHQVLQHVPDPVGMLREMRRVCRPGGIVAARDSDYAAKAWYPPDPVLDEWMAVYQQTARGSGGEPNAGRHLLAWAHAAGLTDVTASASTWCFATDADRAWWGGLWADRAHHSTYADAVDRTRLRGPGAPGAHQRRVAPVGDLTRWLVRRRPWRDPLPDLRRRPAARPRPP